MSAVVYDEKRRTLLLIHTMECLLIFNLLTYSLPTAKDQRLWSMGPTPKHLQPKRKAITGIQGGQPCPVCFVTVTIP